MIAARAAGHHGSVRELSTTRHEPPGAPPAGAGPAPWEASEAGPRSDAGRAGGAGRDPRAEARLRAMVDEHFDFIWRSLRRLGVLPGDVDDCAQQVFVVASRRLDAIAPGSERSFLFGTAMRVASGDRRTRARRREVSLEHGAGGADDDPAGEEAGGAHHPGLSPEDAADQRRARALLDEVLAQMPIDLRTVFVLFELEEMSTPEIAELLEIPGGTAASRLRRAREEFQRLVARASARARGPGGRP